MANAVIILGAGASADFGVPTLRGIFKDPYAQNYLKADKTLQENLERIFWRPRGYTLQTSEQSVTVEEMLTILRDWEQEAGLAERPSGEEFKDFSRRLYTLIYKAVFEGKSTRREHLNPLIAKCRSKLTRVTWASFNWDCVFESSFWYSSGGPGPYGGRHNPTTVIPLKDWRNGEASHEYLKLHGSINWWVVDGEPTYLSFGGGGPLSRKWAEFAQGGATPDFPIILEPSAYKYQDEVYKFLEPQWRIFFERLCEADCVIVVGYSLPEADNQARSKILTSFQANAKSRWLVIDPSPEVCRRFHRLLGQSRLTILEMTLAGVNNDLTKHLMASFDNVDFSDPPAAEAAAQPPAESPGPTG